MATEIFPALNMTPQEEPQDESTVSFPVFFPFSIEEGYSVATFSFILN